MMKPMAKAIIAAGLMTASVAATAGVSANIGAMTDYWFRGLDQSGSAGGASMMGGLDYEHESGVYVGTWLATLPGDLEYDLYAGYNGEVEGLGYSVGLTGYYYDEAEFDYEEINLGLSYGPVSVGYNIGVNDDGAGNEVDYTFASITGEYEGAYATYGFYGEDVDGDYIEVGYGTTYEGMDFGVAAIFGNDEGSGWVTEGNTVMLTISKGFDF
ncbi:MAG: TorF family putative porin [Pontibacterium sp.]